MASESEPPVFYLGLCMAGAISAGAYTAGVVDYLIEALDRWEKARLAGDPRVPQHRVVIDIMTGASAGGMTAAIATAAVHDRMDAVTPQAGGYENFTGQNKLYDAWVKLVADEMLPVMLDTSDLPEHGASSVLNSNFIDHIAQNILRVHTLQNRPYVSDDLELCLSLSNLTGFQEVIAFDNDTETRRTAARAAHEVEGRYISINHRDFGHFVLGNKYHKDGRIPFSFSSETNEGLQTLRDCAMATGAFPLGLRWRAVRRRGRYLRENRFINYKAPQPIFGLEDDQVYASVNVDGGLLNNEPFEIAQDILRSRKREVPDEPTGALDKQAYVQMVNKKTTASVLMIEPFPTIENAPSVRPQPRLLLNTLIGQLYATMRSQLRFKQSDLQSAIKQEVISKYIIAPTRKAGTRKIIGSKAIACGSLGGFGGFLTKAYRTHDFQLGRTNCQRFLQNHFRIAADTENEIFRTGYLRDEARQSFGFAARGQQYLPIIPDLNPNMLHHAGSVLQLPEQAPAYPVKPVAELRALLSRNQKALKTRLFVILQANGLFANVWVGLVVRLFKSVIMGAVVRQIEETVIEDLYDHELVEKPAF